MIAESPCCVSIVMPAFNAERYISDAIRSVLNQSFQAWELIVVDDGSTDRTHDIVSAFSDQRLVLIRQENRGVSAARNVGLNLSRGKYITFADADDVLPPRSLEARVDFLETHPDVGIVDGIISFRDPTLCVELRRHMPSYTGPYFKRLKRLDPRVFSSVVYMFRAELLGKLRFDEAMNHSEDLMFFMRLGSSSNIHYGFVAEAIYLYRTGHVSAMTNLDGWETGYLQVLRGARKLPQMSLADQFLLKTRILTILLRTWLSRRRPGKAFRAMMKVVGA